MDDLTHQHLSTEHSETIGPTSTKQTPLSETLGRESPPPVSTSFHIVEPMVDDYLERWQENTWELTDLDDLLGDSQPLSLDWPPMLDVDVTPRFHGIEQPEPDSGQQPSSGHGSNAALALILPPDWTQFDALAAPQIQSSMSSWAIAGSSQTGGSPWGYIQSNHPNSNEQEHSDFSPLPSNSKDDSSHTGRGPDAYAEPDIGPVQMQNGNLDILHRKRKPQRVRGSLTAEQREKAKMMRRVGNCLRCRAYKLSCDPNTPCKQCRLVLNSARSFFEPCYREKLDRVTLARHGNGNFGQRNVAFVDYFWLEKNAPSKNLEIRWNLPGGRPVDLPLLKITCKEFIPRTNDHHFITWNIGKKLITIELPPFAGDDTLSLKLEVEAFLDKSITKIQEYILQDSTDELVSSTLREAIRFNEKHRSLTIDLALRIQCASFCSQGWGSITGAESLDIKTFDFNEHGKSGYAAYDRGSDKPLPLSIDHQLDVALLLTIKEYKQKLLKQLSKMIFSKTNRPWYEIFLTVFVLLSNLEYVHGGSLSFYLAQVKTGNVGFTAAKVDIEEMKNQKSLDERSHQVYEDDA